jgi:FkbM family methyltransferase
MAFIKTFIKNFFQFFGVEIRRTPQYKPYEWLKGMNIRTILDIGANTGQFASRIHSLLPDAQIYSFEPLASCFEELKRSMKNVQNFQCFNYALGNENGKHTIYHNEFSDSSSLLPMEQIHKDAFPFAQNVKEETIEIRRLDDIADSLELKDNLLIKIDVQGFEDKVIEGGEKTIKRAKILIVETSFESLYRGQLLFDGIYSMLKSQGFVFKGCEEFLQNPKDGHILQCDSVFAREGNLNG